MNNVEWLISQMSNRRLEAEIAACNYELFAWGWKEPNKTLDILWAEFDRRVEAGEMTDDDEELLNDTTKY